MFHISQCSFFYPRAVLWRNVQGTAVWLFPGSKGHCKKRDLLKNCFFKCFFCAWAQNWPPGLVWEPSAGGLALPATVPSYIAFQTAALPLLCSSPHTSHCHLLCQLSVPAYSVASTSPGAAVESSSRWELTCRRHPPTVARLGFQRNLAVVPSLHKGTWETLRPVACGLLDSGL